MDKSSALFRRNQYERGKHISNLLNTKLRANAQEVLLAELLLFSAGQSRHVRKHLLLADRGNHEQ